MKEVPRSRRKVFVNAMACNRLLASEINRTFGNLALIGYWSALRRNPALLACNVALLERTRWSAYCTIREMSESLKMLGDRICYLHTRMPPS